MSKLLELPEFSTLLECPKLSEFDEQLRPEGEAKKIRKHPKYGTITVLEVCPTDRGGLARIACDAYPKGVWVRAAQIGMESVAYPWTYAEMLREYLALGMTEEHMLDDWRHWEDPADDRMYPALPMHLWPRRGKSCPLPKRRRCRHPRKKSFTFSDGATIQCCPDCPRAPSFDKRGRPRCDEQREYVLSGKLSRARELAAPVYGMPL